MYDSRYTVLIDETRRTYPDYPCIYWTFDAETRKGYAFDDRDRAHELAEKLNKEPLRHLKYYRFREIVGLEEFYAG